MLKSELRKKYKALRKELPISERDKLSKEVCIRLLEWLDPNQLTHCYLPIDRLCELDTNAFIQSFNKDKIVVSKADFSQFSMQHFIYSSVRSWRISDFDIPEPENGKEISASKINAVITPLLTFNTKGYRVGYGAGFYDRFFNECSPGCLKVGVSFFSNEEVIDDINENDIPLDLLIHPNGHIKF